MKSLIDKNREIRIVKGLFLGIDDKYLNDTLDQLKKEYSDLRYRLSLKLNDIDYPNNINL
jgi:hypothetical protein